MKLKCCRLKNQCLSCRCMYIRLPNISNLKHIQRQTLQIRSPFQNIVIPPPIAQLPLMNQGLLIIEVSRSRSDTPLSVGLLFTSDQLGAETSTTEHKNSREIDMLPAGFEPVIPGSKRPQTHVVNHETTGIEDCKNMQANYLSHSFQSYFWASNRSLMAFYPYTIL